ncbi:MAG: type II secretion system F family protein [Clostridia bacterium]|nr:type II secretion system F family protein [Clostridia bacterium]
MSDKSGRPVNRRMLDYDAQAVFCRQMAYIAKAGIPFSSASEFLTAENGGEFSQAAAIFSAVKEGSSLSVALRQAGCFSEYLIALVQLGEKTGNLEQTLYELSDYFEQRSSIRRRVRQAFTYPLILFAMMLAVILFLIIEVLPQFADIISGAGGALPAVAAAILGFGLWIRADYLYIVGVIVVIVVAAAVFFKSAAGRHFLDKFLLTRAGFGSTSRKLATARFCSAMKMSLGCGNSFTASLGLTADIIGNSEVQDRLLRLKKLVEAGEEIPHALGLVELFPKSFVSLFATAYRTGNLEETLGRMSSYYQESFDDSVYSITSRIEPALVIVLSCIAGVILFSVMLPIINIMQLIG